MASCYAALEAGVGEVAPSIAPIANGTGQPDTLHGQKMLEASDRKPRCDPVELVELRRHFEGPMRLSRILIVCGMSEWIQSGECRPKKQVGQEAIDCRPVDVLESRIPSLKGGVGRKELSCDE